MSKKRKPTKSGKNRPKDTTETSRGFILDEKVDMEIDLHGFAIDEAMVEIELQVRALQKAGYEKLRVIHGQYTGGTDSIYRQMRRNLEKEWRTLVQGYYHEAHNAGATILVIRT